MKRGLLVCIDFEKQDLLEFSLVPIPANPRALIEASKSMNLTPIKDWAEEALDTWYEKDSDTGVLLPREKAEELHSLLSSSSYSFSSNVDSDKGGDADTEERGAISYSSAHKNGTPKADEGASWDGPKEVSAAEVSDLKVMCAWVDSDNDDKKSAYKLPHHRASGEHKVVWGGVSAAGQALMGARGGVNIPDGDKQEAKTHLAKHYREFSKTPPWESEEGTTYELIVSLEAEGRATPELIDLKDNLERSLFPELFEDGSDADELDFSDPRVAEIIGEAVREEVRQLTGHS